MSDKIKSILIGFFVLLAAIIGTSMVLFLKPKIGDGKKTLHVRFTNIAGITVGTRVAFAGKPVGEVIHIREITDARQSPDALGRIYFYELTLQTDSSVEIYDSDEIAVRSIGLMGEKSVAILPKQSQAATVITDQIIYANSTDPLDNTFTQITKAASRLEDTISHVDNWIQENSNPLSASIQSIHDAINQLTSAKNTVGRFLTTDDLYLHLISVMSKAETLMNDINHYGLLFQYDKHWQRGRTKKANLLKALDSPKEFTTYFNEEIDTMTTSLGRLSTLLERSAMEEGKEKIFENETFKQQFAALLRSAQTLTDTLKLYNQELQKK